MSLGGVEASTDAGGEDEGESKVATVAGRSSLYLSVGLQNGVLLQVCLVGFYVAGVADDILILTACFHVQSEIDTATGSLSDTRTRFLGAKAVQLFTTEVCNVCGACVVT